MMVGRGGRDRNGNQMQHIEESWRMVEDLSHLGNCSNKLCGCPPVWRFEKATATPQTYRKVVSRERTMKERRRTVLTIQAQRFSIFEGIAIPRVQALDLNVGGIKRQIADFFGEMHAEDYLDC